MCKLANLCRLCTSRSMAGSRTTHEGRPTGNNSAGPRTAHERRPVCNNAAEPRTAHERQPACNNAAGPRTAHERRLATTPPGRGQPTCNNAAGLFQSFNQIRQSFFEFNSVPVVFIVLSFFNRFNYEICGDCTCFNE